MAEINNNNSQEVWVQVKNKNKNKNKGPQNNTRYTSSSESSTSYYSYSSSTSSTTRRPQNGKSTSTRPIDTSKDQVDVELKCAFHQCVPNCPGDKRCFRMGREHMNKFHKDCQNKTKDISQHHKKGGSKFIRKYENIKKKDKTQK